MTRTVTVIVVTVFADWSLNIAMIPYNVSKACLSHIQLRYTSFSRLIKEYTHDEEDFWSIPWSDPESSLLWI